MFENDPQFQKLKLELKKASIAFKNAVEHRGRVRQMFKDNRTKPKPARRPVGSPSDFRIPEEQPGSKAAPQKTKEFKIYMGPILGWQKLRPAPGPAAVSGPEDPLNVDKFFDQVSLKLYWNAKMYYLHCKDKFDKYVRKEIEKKRLPAAEFLRFGEYSQLLGMSGDGFIKGAKNVVEKNCKEALAYIKSFPEEKPREAIILFLENMADSQFVGLEGETTKQMESELQVLHSSGQLQKE